MNPATARFTGPLPTLTDGVVTLRAPRTGDLDDVIMYCSDPEMRRWMAFPEPFTRADADAAVAQAAAGWAADTRYQFGLELDGRLIGGVNLEPRVGGLAEIGYGLTAEHRGRGLMARALRLALAWGFDQAGLEVVRWRAPAGNWASRRVAWSVGFRVGAVTPGLLEQEGRRLDGWLAVLRRGDRREPAHPWYEPATVRGRSVVLRAHREQDLARMVEACRDPQTQHWLPALPDDYTERDAYAHLQEIQTRQARGRAVYWAVADPDDDRMLAELGIFVQGRKDPQGEIGYWTHPDTRGRGITSEAVRLAVRHALLPVEEGGLGLSRILLRADTGNVGSQRVAEKSGFTRTGCDRDANLFRDGSRGDSYRYDLLPVELPAVR